MRGWLWRVAGARQHLTEQLLPARTREESKCCPKAVDPALQQWTTRGVTSGPGRLLQSWVDYLWTILAFFSCSGGQWAREVTRVRKYSTACDSPTSPATPLECIFCPCPIGGGSTHVGRPETGGKSGGSWRRAVVPSHMQRKILEESHGGRNSGHFCGPCTYSMWYRVYAL